MYREIKRTITEIGCILLYIQDSEFGRVIPLNNNLVNEKVKKKVKLQKESTNKKQYKG